MATSTKDVVTQRREAYEAAGKSLSAARAKVYGARTSATRRKAQDELAKARNTWNEARVEMIRAEADEVAQGTMNAAPSSSS